MHALGEKHSGLGKVLVNAGVRETFDVAGLKQAMQVRPRERMIERKWSTPAAGYCAPLDKRVR